MTQPPNPISDDRLGRVTFWQKRSVQRVFPWATSLGFHIGLLVAALFLVPALVRTVASQTSKEEIVVPDATLTDSKPGGIPNPGLGNDPTRRAAQENDPNAENRGWMERKSESLSQTLQSAAVAPGDQQLRSADTLPISALASGAGVAGFGPRGGGGGAGPQSRIFGHGGNVRKIIYVCDGSGSLVGSKEDVLRAELNRAISNLAPIQAFNVLIFQEKDSSDHFISTSDNLVMASPRNKTQAFDFLQPATLTFHGDTNPVPALQEAFREKPQLIFLLTDGVFDNPSGQEVLDEINRLNADKRVHVNTILLLGSKKEQDSYKDFENLMDRIAGQNGGVYKKFYSDEE